MNTEPIAEKDVPVTGVWMVGHFDWNWITESVHALEIEALRIVNGRGYGEVHFLPFGMETWEASHRTSVLPPGEGN